MAQINYSAAEVDQMMDTALFGSNAVIGISLPRNRRVARNFANVRTITQAGWYRIATISGGGSLMGTLRIGGVYNSRRPTYAIVDVSNTLQTGSTGYAPKWATRMCTAAGSTVSKIRLASDGEHIGSQPTYIDIYIPYAMTGSTGQTYFYDLDTLGPITVELQSPTLVESEPAQTNEFTLVNT